MTFLALVFTLVDAEPAPNAGVESKLESAMPPKPREQRRRSSRRESGFILFDVKELLEVKDGLGEVGPDLVGISCGSGLQFR